MSIDAVVDLFRDLIPRQPPLVVVVALYGVFATVVTAWTFFLVARHGGPHRWPTLQALVVVAFALGGSICWFWINGPVEGRTLVDLSHSNGITDGDVLALPALIGATVVLAAKAVAGAGARVRSPYSGGPSTLRGASRSPDHRRD